MKKLHIYHTSEGTLDQREERESEQGSTYIPSPEQPKWAAREQSGLKGTTHPSEDPDSAERYAQHPEQ